MAQTASTTRRAPSRRAKNSSRNTVPAFVLKTYNIINDSKNHDLIRWSESGGSFFILDQGRLARQVLGRWFKHENFNSFVRQLNNYGFYKIQDLQQGALRNETDTEYACFAHTRGYFRRGEPNLLSLIRPGAQANRTRSRNPAHTQTKDCGDDDNAMDLIDVDDSCTVSPPTIAWGQVPDATTTSPDIVAIKQEQANLTAELDRLRHQNQLLFQESVDCRAKVQQHQETIGQILGFLSRVYETYHSKNNKGDTGTSNGCSDAVVLHGLILQGSQGQLGSKSPRNFEVVEVEAAASEVKNKVSMYSIETPAEDAASPTSSLDDGCLGSAAATHDPRISDDPFYDPNPRHHNIFSFFNPNVTLDQSAHLANLSHPRYGDEQAGMLASALNFPTPQALSPLNVSRLAMNITKDDFETEEQTKAEDRPGEPSTTASPPMVSFGAMPTTPPRATTLHYPTFSPTFEYSPSLSTDTLPSSPDISFENTPSFAGSDFALNPLSYFTGVGMGNYGNEDWMNGIGIDTINDASGINIDVGTNGGGLSIGDVGATSLPSANAGVMQGVSPSFIRGPLASTHAMTTTDATTEPMNASPNTSTGVNPN